MLRPILLIALCLMASLSIAGGLLAREWGWSEYASDELYLIYYQQARRGTRYFLVNIDGSSAGEALGWTALPTAAHWES